MINRVILVGRLTKDPELRYTPSGVAVATFRLACNRPYTNQNGEHDADFVNIVVWRKQAENVANYLKKGSLAGVDGRIQTRTYEAQDGRKVFVTEVVAESVQFLEPKSRNGNNNNNNNVQNNGSEAYPFGGSNWDDDPFANEGTPIDISDDDLPF
jgi:single-strand DNA-binding protein